LVFHGFSIGFIIQKFGSSRMVFLNRGLPPMLIRSSIANNFLDCGCWLIWGWLLIGTT
jgi:hypothetical protein